ncbi:hypothetical protein cypCar_00038460 [Cyprinus carpio]|nr:hypothetical protein cypCar_00038460 [Cyprinus carpio]
MGNTSSERSGAEKTQRRESRGGKDGARPKILMDSAEDGDIFQTDDAKEFLAWQQDQESDTKGLPEERPTVFRWNGPGKEIYLSGSFNNWSSKIPLTKRSLA